MRKQDYIVISIITLAAWSVILFDHFNGGVPSHYLLQDENMPAISNWWGALIIPVLTFVLLIRIRKRTSKNQNKVTSLGYLKHSIIAFIASLLFGSIVSILFINGYDDITGYMMLSIFPLAIFVPLFRGEYLLGLVLGMYYTFGAFIPTVAGIIICCICAILYKWIRPIILFPFSKRNISS